MPKVVGFFILPKLLPAVFQAVKYMHNINSYKLILAMIFHTNAKILNFVKNIDCFSAN